MRPTKVDRWSNPKREGPEGGPKAGGAGPWVVVLFASVMRRGTLLRGRQRHGTGRSRPGAFGVRLNIEAWAVAPRSASG
jgi:hypothetical protein